MLPCLVPQMQRCVSVLVGHWHSTLCTSACTLLYDIKLPMRAMMHMVQSSCSWSGLQLTTSAGSSAEEF